jgi:hypothetical protein
VSVPSLNLVDKDPPESGFTRAAGDVELLSRPAGFSGAISLPLLPDLIQIYTVSLANGALTIRRGNDYGTIWFDRGEMVHAVCGRQTGEEAVYRMLQWQTGLFSLDPDARSSIRSITASWQNVLMEGCRLLDEEAASRPSAAVNTALDGVLTALEQALGGIRAVAVFEADGTVVTHRSAVEGLDLAAQGPELIEMLLRQTRVMEALAQPPSLLDCFWLLGDELHLIEPLRGGRVLHLAVDRGAANLALIRRAVDRVAEDLA